MVTRRHIFQQLVKPRSSFLIILKQESSIQLARGARRERIAGHGLVTAGYFLSDNILIFISALRLFLGRASKFFKLCYKNYLARKSTYLNRTMRSSYVPRHPASDACRAGIWASAGYLSGKRVRFLGGGRAWVQGSQHWSTSDLSNLSNFTPNNFVPEMLVDLFVISPFYRTEEALSQPMSRTRLRGRRARRFQLPGRVVINCKHYLYIFYSSLFMQQYIFLISSPCENTIYISTFHITVRKHIFVKVTFCLFVSNCDVC